MKLTKLIAATFTVAALGLPAWAQETEGAETAETDMQDADVAADAMMTTVYAREVPAYWTPSEVIARLQELGYTDIDEFDVEWGEYEVEAIAPNGNEVEIEISPVTGEILDIDDNWF